MFINKCNIQFKISLYILQSMLKQHKMYILRICRYKTLNTRYAIGTDTLILLTCFSTIPFRVCPLQIERIKLYQNSSGTNPTWYWVSERIGTDSAMYIQVCTGGTCHTVLVPYTAPRTLLWIGCMPIILFDEGADMRVYISQSKLNW